jgi:hypothetical protein
MNNKSHVASGFGGIKTVEIERPVIDGPEVKMRIESVPYNVTVALSDQALQDRFVAMHMGDTRATADLPFRVVEVDTDNGKYNSFIVSKAVREAIKYSYEKNRGRY